MGYVLTFDFETRDPSISQKRGAGWAFKDFDVLGMAYKIDNTESRWTDDTHTMRQLVAGARTLIAHNAQYDVGCLHFLGIDYTDQIVLDTLILTKLYDNRLQSYSLDELGSSFLGENKDYAALEQAASELGLRRYMGHMDLLYAHRPDLVIQYAKKDVELTYGLSQWLKTNLYQEGLELIPFYSDLIKALVRWRAKGVRIDTAQAAMSITKLREMEMDARETVKEYFGDVNIESTKQVSEAVLKLGLTPGTSEKGGMSVDSKWRAAQDHPAITALSDAKKYQKLRREFVEGLLERMVDGRIHPELNILGAVETGRFTSTNPNIQQIPKRDEVAGAYIRSLIVGEPGEKVYSLDFSSQEPRLQVHYAYKVGSPGADILRESFLKNAQHDLHQQVADLAGIDRKTAKTVNLGISYGMGVAKLAATLKLEETEARKVLNKYKTLTPYLANLNKQVQAAATRRGYITTLLGRRLYVENGYEYKSLNKLIQGSAADQTAMAMVQAYREGLDISFSVHDELVMCTSDRSKAERLKEIMETIADLTVPCYTEIQEGDSWSGG